MTKTALQIAKSLESVKLATDSINLFVAGSDYDTFIDEDLPTPSYLVPTDAGYHIGWFLDGYTHTLKGITYKNDTLKKLSLVLEGSIEAVPPRNISNSYYLGAKYHLGEINENLRNLRKSAKGFKILQSGDDAAFNVIRAEAYQMKKEGTLNYDALLDFGLSNIPSLNISKKSFGDIQSKCKNIFNWTEKFYNAGSKRRVTIMSRYEASVNATQHRIDYTQTKVFNYLKSLKSLGTNIDKLTPNFISKVLKVTWRTAKHYLYLFKSILSVGNSFKEHIPLIVQLKSIVLNDMREIVKKCTWFTAPEYAKELIYSSCDNYQQEERLL